MIWWNEEICVCVSGGGKLGWLWASPWKKKHNNVEPLFCVSSLSGDSGTREGIKRTCRTCLENHGYWFPISNSCHTDAAVSYTKKNLFCCCVKEQDNSWIHLYGNDPCSRTFCGLPRANHVAKSGPVCSALQERRKANFPQVKQSSSWYRGVSTCFLGLPEMRARLGDERITSVLRRTEWLIPPPPPFQPLDTQSLKLSHFLPPGTNKTFPTYNALHRITKQISLHAMETGRAQCETGWQKGEGGRG